jgi:hypothetical protein
VSAGGRDFERALGALLAFDVLEIERCALRLARLRLRAGDVTYVMTRFDTCPLDTSSSTIGLLASVLPKSMSRIHMSG